MGAMREWANLEAIAQPVGAVYRQLRREARRLGRKGGRALARRLFPEERRESARKAALARWRQKKPRSG